MNIAFTGHRPNNKNMGGYDWNSTKNHEIRKAIFREIVYLINDSEDKEFRFITGGALGVDQFAFNVVDEYVGFNASINIINELAIPFKDQPNAWFKQEDKDRYNHQVSRADIVTYVDETEGYKNYYSTGQI